jgi:NDP-sugar pyrophosphorylase family protein
MKKDLTLLVLAAGMGSRFGGLKQIEPVGPNGEFIIDYSVYDAIRAGFNKVVFIIKEENYELFKSTIGKRIADKIKVEYVFQKITDIPDGIEMPKDRVKPLGTAQAVYAARDTIKENFAIVNADDFYGRDGYMKAAEFLNNCKDDEYANVAYQINNTMSKNGAVKRGVIFEKDGYITELIESSVEYVDGKIISTPLRGGEPFMVEPNTPVSMNLFCLTPKIFEYIKNNIKEFFLNQEDLMTCEYLIPTVVGESAKYNNKSIRLLTTDSRYYGMTYREDLEELKSGILSEIENGTYNKDLWG